MSLAKQTPSNSSSIENVSLANITTMVLPLKDVPQSLFETLHDGAVLHSSDILISPWLKVGMHSHSIPRQSFHSKYVCAGFRQAFDSW